MAGGFLFLSVFFAALRTACPTVAFDDTGEACLAALTLGIPHPPGYPIFTLVTSLWAGIPLGSIAFRLNIFSAFLVASASVLAFSVFRRMGGRSIYTGMAVALLATLFAASWSQAGLGKGAVYSLNLCITLGILRELWSDEKGFRNILSASLLFGLGLAHHWMSMVAVFPLLAWMILKFKEPGKPRLILLCVSTILLGFGGYLFLVVRAMASPFLNWGNPRNLDSLIFVISRRQYLSFMPGEVTMPLSEKFNALMGAMDGAAPLAVILALMAVGIGALYRKNHGALQASIFMPLAVFFGLLIFIPVRPGAVWFLETYSIPAIALLVIIAGIGLEQVASLIGPRKASASALVLIFCFCAWNLPGRWRANDRARDFYTWDLAENLAGHSAERGLIFGSSDAVIFGNWYAWLVEERLKCPAVPVPLLPMPWVATGFAGVVPGLRTPYPGPRVGAESIPALLRAWSDANPVFFQWSFLTEPARAAFERKRMVADGWMYRIRMPGENYSREKPVNRLRHLRLRGLFSRRLSADARQNASIRPLTFSGLLTWGRGVMDRDPVLARRAFRLAGMLAEGTVDQGLCSLEMGNLEASKQQYKNAERCYLLAIAQDPLLTVASRNLAMLLLSQQRVRESMAIMEKIIKEAPESEESRELLPIYRQLEKN